MKFLVFQPESSQARSCAFDDRNLSNVNRSTDERLTGDMAEIAERRLNALRAAAPTVSLSLEILSEQIRPQLTVRTFHGSRLRLRNDSGRVIGHINNNSRVQFEGETKLSRDANGQRVDTDVPPDGSLENRHLWFKVRTNSGQIGWASAEYLRGSISELPEPEPERTPAPTPEPTRAPDPERTPEPTPAPTEAPEGDDGLGLTFDIPEFDLGDTPFYRAPAAAALERITDNDRAHAAITEAIRVSTDYERLSAERGVNGHNPVPEPISEAERVLPLPFDEQVAQIAADTEVPPDRVRAMLMDLSRWDADRVLADPEGFRVVVEDLNARYGEDFARFAPRAMDLAPGLAFFRHPAIRPILGRWLPAIGGGLLWSRIISSEGGDWTTFNWPPDENWRTGNIAVDTGAYFVPFAGNMLDYRDAQLEWRNGEYGMAVISATSGTIGMVLDGVSVATAWTGVGFAAGQGVRGGVKVGLRGLKAGIRYLGRDTVRSVWDVMTFRALRPGARGIDAATATLRGQRAADTPEAGARQEYETTRPETEVVARPQISEFENDPRFHSNALAITRNLRESETEASFIYESAAFRLEKNTETDQWFAIDTHGNSLEVAAVNRIGTLRENVLQRSLDFYDQDVMPRIQRQIDRMPALMTRLRSAIAYPQRFKRQAESVIEQIKAFDWNRLNILGRQNREVIETARQQNEAEFKQVSIEKAQHRKDAAQARYDRTSRRPWRWLTSEKQKLKLAAKVQDAEYELNRVQAADPVTLVRDHQSNSWWRGRLNELGHRVSESRFMNRGDQRAAQEAVQRLRAKNQTLNNQQTELASLERQRDALPPGPARRDLMDQITTLRGEIETTRQEIETEVTSVYARVNAADRQQILGDRIDQLRGQLNQANTPSRIRAIRQEIDALETYRLANINPRLSELRGQLTVGNTIRIQAADGQTMEFELSSVRAEIEANENEYLVLRSAADAEGDGYQLKVEVEGSQFRVTNLDQPSQSYLVDRIQDVPNRGRRTATEAQRMYDDLEVGSVIINRNDPDFRIEIIEVRNENEGVFARMTINTRNGLETTSTPLLKSQVVGYLRNEHLEIQ